MTVGPMQSLSTEAPVPPRSGSAFRPERPSQPRHCERPQGAWQSIDYTQALILSLSKDEPVEA